MGCISSKSSDHQQSNDHQINPIPNHHVISRVSPSNTNHKIDDVLELMAAPKHDDMLTIQDNTNHKKDDAFERCASFHTVEEYDELLQKISSSNDAGLSVAPASVPDTTDSTCKKDSNVEPEIKRNKPVDMGNMEFQTVASLRQWLHSPSGGGGGGGVGVADKATDHTALKFGFSFHDNNNINNDREAAGEKLVLVETGKQPEEESIVELVAAFDQYMQQLQIDEDNILKQIHNTEWVS